MTDLAMNVLYKYQPAMNHNFDLIFIDNIDFCLDRYIDQNIIAHHYRTMKLGDFQKSMKLGCIYVCS